MLRANEPVIGDLQNAARIVGREQAPEDWGRLTVGSNIASGGEGVPIKTLDAQAIAPCPFLEIFRRKLDQETVGIDVILSAGTAEPLRDLHNRSANGFAIGQLVIRTPIREITLDLHWRSEEHTSELQSIMRNSSAVFCLKKQK